MRQLDHSVASGALLLGWTCILVLIPSILLPCLDRPAAWNFLGSIGKARMSRVIPFDRTLTSMPRPYLTIGVACPTVPRQRFSDSVTDWATLSLPQHSSYRYRWSVGGISFFFFEELLDLGRGSFFFKSVAECFGCQILVSVNRRAHRPRVRIFLSEHSILLGTDRTGAPSFGRCVGYKLTNSGLCSKRYIIENTRSAIQFSLLFLPMPSPGE